MNKLDKKQIPQFAALCVLTSGVFGYFVVKIVTPSPAAAAGTRPHPVTDTEASRATSAASPAPGKKPGTGPDATPAEAEAEAPAPTPGMRDPFVVGYLDPKTPPALPAAAPVTKPAKAAGPQVASIHEVGPAPTGVPAAPTLPPSFRAFAPLPAAPALPVTPKQKNAMAATPEAPAAPTWTVTGVLQNEAGQVAVLRNGEARRIVRTGDFVDSVYRVVAVTRSAVVLRHGKTVYHLTLGAAQPAGPTPARPAPLSAPAPTFPLIRQPQDAALSPAGHSAEVGMAQVIQAALLLARSYMAPAQAEVEVCLAAFHTRAALPPRVAMRFLDGSTAVPGSQDARARLERGRDLYQSGQRAEGRAEWRQVLAMDDPHAATEAGKLLDRYN